MKDKPVILVVDDRPQNIELLEAYLVPQGYEIIKAANGEEALEKLSGNQIDLILLDVMMPGMDGFEVTRRVRQDNAHRLLPIILVTALRETEDRVKGIDAGCDDFISKPVDKMELLARVRSLLKVKAYNDLMSNYRKELESEVARRTEQLRQALEEINRFAEAAQGANVVKGEFLANISHELRTPLNGIMGFTELMLDTELSDEQKEYLGVVQDSAESLLQLINDTLDFSEIESGAFELRREAFSLRESLEDILRMIGPRAEEKGLALSSRVSEAVPDDLVGDPWHLRQVIVNLLGNGVKFTEEGEVSVSVETASESEKGLHLRFAVTDTGCGIEPEREAVIFEAFAQANGSATRRYGGMGLGLAISARLIQLMGGSISVESRPGKGSTFHFTVGFERPSGI